LFPERSSFLRLAREEAEGVNLRRISAKASGVRPTSWADSGQRQGREGRVKGHREDEALDVLAGATHGDLAFPNLAVVPKIHSLAILNSVGCHGPEGRRGGQVEGGSR
jgi:hypothetical protein